jgi:hypothetical protein
MMVESFLKSLIALYRIRIVDFDDVHNPLIHYRNSAVFKGLNFDDSYPRMKEGMYMYNAIKLIGDNIR